MKRMTPATRLLFDALKGKYLYFFKRNMLANDGSFYCIDERLMERLGIGDNTIRRARIFLKEAGEINYLLANIRAHLRGIGSYQRVPKWNPLCNV